MAKIVLAGRSDCPYFARCELLGDKLSKNLQKFKLHKIIVQPDQWENWLSKTCSERGWNFKKSPIVWRELIDRGGKGVLIGDANDFQEYAKAYYDVLSEMTTLDMNVVSWENKITKDLYDEEEKYYKSLSHPINICITNAASPICYYLLNSLVSGNVFGPDVQIIIRLLVSSVNDYEIVKGTAMEAEDLASGILRGLKVCTNPHDAFEDCRFIIMLDSVNKKTTETAKAWLERNEEFFSRYGVIMNAKALKSCKVLLCGNGPLNFNATIVAENAPNLPHQNIVVVSALIENHAKSVVGEKLNINPAGVVNLIVWGNVNGRYHLDLNNSQIHEHHGAVMGPKWYSVPAVETIHDMKWIEKEFPKLVAARHHKTTETEGNLLTGLCSASAIASTLQNWCRGSPLNEIFSLGVSSEGWYGVPIGMFFSFPVTMKLTGCWQVVQDIEITKETRDAIEASVQEQGRHFLLCMGDRKQSENPEEWDKASQSSDNLSLWSQLSLGRRSVAGDVFPGKPVIEIRDSYSVQKKISEYDEEAHEGLGSLEELDGNLMTETLPEDMTVTPADVTLDQDDDNLVQEEHLPAINDSNFQQLADVTLTDDDNLSQPNVHALHTDEDNTSLEVVTLQDASTAHDAFPPGNKQT